jgi:hypothetical protein
MMSGANASLRKTAAAFLAGVAALSWVESALGLSTEHFGNAPILRTWGFSKNVLDVVNLPSRVYWYETNGDPHFFFRGKTADLNEALRKFAAIGGKTREVILLPGPGETSNLTREKRVSFDWDLRTPAGLYLALAGSEKGTKVFTIYPTLTIYVTSAAHTSVDRPEIERWIGDLDDTSFTVRQKATRNLENLGNAAGPFLRRALRERRSLEGQRRIQSLLDQLAGIDLAQIEIPPGVAVLDLNDLRDRYLQGLKSANYDVRGSACGGLGTLCRYSDEWIPTLIDMLGADKHENVRRCASASLARLGSRAKQALPVLKAGFDDPDVNIRNAFRQAATMIEQAKEDPVLADQAKKQRELLESIRTFRQVFADHSQK